MRGLSVAAKTPGQVFDLSSFSLQIPEGSSGGITTIKQPALDSYTSDYFQVDPDDSSSVLFFAPETGNPTGNGAGPRTELTETHEFTFSGTHEMNVTVAVTEANPNGNVVIAQIKGDSVSSKSVALASCLIVVELGYNINDQEVTAHMRGLNSDGTCSSVSYSVGSYKPGELIHVHFRVVDYSVYVYTDKVTLPKYSYSFWKGHDYEMHFKTGAYDQDSGNDSSAGGRTLMHKLDVYHSE